jgi:divalent metal cation (Fe/Co/Zn/Cd) transporter
MNVQLVKRVIKLVLGWSFILLGIVGIFLPILQGLLFLFIGLVLLSSESKTARKILDRLEARYPKESATIHAFVNHYLHGEGFLMVFTAVGSLVVAGGGIFLGVVTHSMTLFALGMYFLSQGGIMLFTIEHFYMARIPSPHLFSSEHPREKLYWIFYGAIILLSATTAAIFYRVAHGALTLVPLHFWTWNFLGLTAIGGIQLFLFFTIWREMKRIPPLQSPLLLSPMRYPLSPLFPPLVSLCTIGISFLGLLLTYYSGKALFDIVTALLVSGGLIGWAWKVTRDYRSSFVRMGIAPTMYDDLENILRDFPFAKVSAVHILPITLRQTLIVIELQSSPTLSPADTLSYHQQIEDAIKKKFPSCMRVLISSSTTQNLSEQ